MSLAGIKKYIVGLVIKLSTDGTHMQEEKVFVSKLNIILVQVRCPDHLHRRPGGT